MNKTLSQTVKSHGYYKISLERLEVVIHQKSKRPCLNCQDFDRHGGHVIKAAQEMGVNPNLAVSIAAVESSFNPSAISSSGATGLGQFTRGAWLDRIKGAKHPELKALQKLSEKNSNWHIGIIHD